MMLFPAVDPDASAHTDEPEADAAEADDLADDEAEAPDDEEPLREAA
jgi:hypothetical protein